jgi:glycosyltransferase involved in cell wall biosynthesis
MARNDRSDRGRIVFVTQKVDPEHPALAATVPKIAALAALVDEVVVLTDDAVPGVLPENCRVHAFGAPTRLGRGRRFVAALATEIARRPQPIAVVAHMCPIYAVLAAPLARPLGMRLLLWYTHWHASGLLRVAERLVSDVVSVDRRSFPVASSKVTPLGHGIDVAEFPYAARPQLGSQVRVLMLGRTSRAKGLVQVVRGVAEARSRGLDVGMLSYGPSLTEAESVHRSELVALVSELGLGEAVTIGEAVARSRVPALLAAADLLVNNMEAGAPDKVVYEAAASGVPVIASNPVFDDLIEPRWLFDRDDPGALADRLAAFAALSHQERTTIGQQLRQRVSASHSVASWAEGILRVARR